MHSHVLRQSIAQRSIRPPASPSSTPSTDLRERLPSRSSPRSRSGACRSSCCRLRCWRLLDFPSRKRTCSSGCSAGPIWRCASAIASVFASPCRAGGRFCCHLGRDRQQRRCVRLPLLLRLGRNVVVVEWRPANHCLGIHRGHTADHHRAVGIGCVRKRGGGLSKRRVGRWLLARDGHTLSPWRSRSVRR